MRDADTGRLQLTDETAIVLVLIPAGRFHMGAQKGTNIEQDSRAR